VIIYGPSGCGKSTLLYSISGLQTATEGDVSVEGKNIARITKKEMVELHQVGTGMIFQAFYLIPSLTVLDNVCLPKVFRGESTARRREEGIKLLHRFSIVEQGDKFPSQLSGGQKQRVSIARSLINNPQIILADEPVGNLDSVSSENVMRILKELNEIDKKTVILVTHNAEYLHYADRIIYMKDGRVLKEEVNKEKRPVEALKNIPDVKYEELTNELKLLMRSFKNLSLQQVGSLLVPFKSNQIMSHILSQLNEEQVQTAGAYLKEYLFNNIDINAFQKNLDLSFEKGGAGWNSQRVNSFVKRLGDIINNSKIISEQGGSQVAVSNLSQYLTDLFKIKMDKDMKKRFDSFIQLRISNKMDRIELQKGLDASKILGGVGLRKDTAEKISREVEIIMLVKYSS
jgi:ABC-type lipoprotein export system ATPase subunit